MDHSHCLFPNHPEEDGHYQQHTMHDPLVTNTPQPIGIPTPHHTVPIPHQAPAPVPGDIPTGHHHPGVPLTHRPPVNPVYQMHNNVTGAATPPSHRVYHNVQSPPATFVPSRGPCPFLVPVDPMFVPEFPIPGSVHMIRPEMVPRRNPCPVSYHGNAMNKAPVSLGKMANMAKITQN